MSRMRFLTRALRDCQATPPSRSSCTPASSEPTRDSTSMFSTGTNSLSPPARDPRQAVTEDVLLAEQHELPGREALLDRQYREPDRREGQLCKGIAVGDPPQVGNPALAQHAEEPLGGALAEGGDRRPPTGFALCFQVISHRLEQHDVRIGALGGEIARRASPDVEPLAVAFRRGEGRQSDQGPTAQCCLPFEVVEV